MLAGKHSDFVRERQAGNVNMTNCIDIAKVGAGGGAAEPAAFVWKQNTYKLLVDIDIRALFKGKRTIPSIVGRVGF